MKAKWRFFFAVIVALTGCTPDDHDIKGWQLTRWNMSREAVAGAVSQMGYETKPGIGCIPTENGNCIFTLEGDELFVFPFPLSGQNCAVIFNFDAEHRLTSVRINNGTWRSWEYVVGIYRSLVEKYGKPTNDTFKEDTRRDFDTSWEQPSGSLKISAYDIGRDGDVSFTITYRKSKGYSTNGL